MLNPFYTRDNENYTHTIYYQDVSADIRTILQKEWANKRVKGLIGSQVYALTRANSTIQRQFSLNNSLPGFP